MDARFFAPRGIVLIGASPRPTAPANRLLRALEAGGYAGQIHLVNGKYDDIGGRRAYASVGDLPGPLDLAVIALAAHRCIPALEECAAAGLRNVVVVSAGFGETGEVGQRLQRALSDTADRLGMSLLGPNTMGFANVAERVYATFSSPLSQPQTAGGVAFISQSGGVAGLLSELAEGAGIGKSIVAAVGNEAGLDQADVLRYVAARDDTTVAVLYIENVHRARRLLVAIEEAVLRGIRVVALIGGSSDAGAKAASSHTGALTQRSFIAHQLLTAAGAVVTDSLLSTVTVAQLLSVDRRRWPRIDRPARAVFLATSGGYGVLASDAASRQGLTLPDLSPSLAAQLGDLLPSYVHVGNPIDLPPEVVTDPQMLGRIANVVCADRDIDLVAVVGGQHVGAAGLTCAEGIARGLATSERAVVAIWPSVDAQIRNVFTEAGVGCAESADDAFLAARNLFGAPAAAGRADEGEPAGVRVSKRVVTEVEIKGRLGHLGVAVPDLQVLTSRQQAEQAGRDLTFPVAVKGISPHVAHKAAAGLIRFGVATAGDLVEAYDQIAGRLRELDLEVDGVVIAEEMTPPGCEVFLGITRNPGWGALVLMGPGGGDVESRSELQAGSVDKLRAGHELDCYLDRVLPTLERFPATARPEVTRVVRRLLDIWSAEDGWEEFEINPMVVSAAAVTVVDAMAVPLARVNGQSPIGDRRASEPVATRAPTAR